MSPTVENRSYIENSTFQDQNIVKHLIHFFVRYIELSEPSRYFGRTPNITIMAILVLDLVTHPDVLHYNLT